MTEARHSVQLLSEEFGLHLPRGVTSFLASLGPVAGAMEAAFPFIAIAVGATFLIEKLMKLGDEAAKTGKEWTAISDDVAKWGESSKKELLDVQIQLDKLTGDKLKELQDTLKRIDLTTLEHLKSEFDGVSKKVDEAFTKMRSSWLMTQIGMGNGVADVQEMFASAMDKINADLAKGDQKQLASDLKAASDQMWNLAEPTYALVQRLHEAHNETGATRIAADEHYQALLKAHGVLASMTSELRDQEKLEKGKAELATQTITPIHDATDPRVAEERKKDLAGYMETARQKAAAAEKLAETEMAMETAVTRYFGEERAKQEKIAQEAGKEDDRHGDKMGELQLAADQEAGQMRMAQRRMSAEQIADMELSYNAREYAAKQTALQSELAAISGHDAEAENKKRILNDKLLELDRQFQNKDQALEDAAQKKRLQTVQAAEDKVDSAYAGGFSKVLMGKQSFAQMMAQTDAQMAEKSLQNLIMSAMQRKGVQGTTRFDDARTAAADAFASAGNPYLGAIEAAGAFASVMAFAGGGIVPGVGSTDSVSAVLTPGETVLPKRMTEELTHAAKFGGDSSGGDVHVHHSPTYHIHAIDGASVRGMLTKHKEEFSQHFHGELRKMNR